MKHFNVEKIAKNSKYDFGQENADDLKALWEGLLNYLLASKAQHVEFQYCIFEALTHCYEARISKNKNTQDLDGKSLDKILYDKITAETESAQVTLFWAWALFKLSLRADTEAWCFLTRATTRREEAADTNSQAAEPIKQRLLVESMSRLNIYYQYWAKISSPSLAHHTLLLEQFSALLQRAKKTAWTPFEYTLFMRRHAQQLDDLLFSIEKKILTELEAPKQNTEALLEASNCFCCIFYQLLQLENELAINDDAVKRLRNFLANDWLNSIGVINVVRQEIFSAENIEKIIAKYSENQHAWILLMSAGKASLIYARKNQLIYYKEENIEQSMLAEINNLIGLEKENNPVVFCNNYVNLQKLLNEQAVFPVLNTYLKLYISAVNLRSFVINGKAMTEPLEEPLTSLYVESSFEYKKQLIRLRDEFRHSYKENFSELTQFFSAIHAYTSGVLSILSSMLNRLSSAIPDPIKAEISIYLKGSGALKLFHLASDLDIIFFSSADTPEAVLYANMLMQLFHHALIGLGEAWLFREGGAYAFDGLSLDVEDLTPTLFTEESFSSYIANILVDIKKNGFKTETGITPADAFSFLNFKCLWTSHGNIDEAILSSTVLQSLASEWIATVGYICSEAALHKLGMLHNDHQRDIKEIISSLTLVLLGGIYIKEGSINVVPEFNLENCLAALSPYLPKVTVELIFRVLAYFHSLRLDCQFSGDLRPKIAGIFNNNKQFADFWLLFKACIIEPLNKSWSNWPLHTKHRNTYFIKSKLQLEKKSIDFVEKKDGLTIAPAVKQQMVDSLLANAKDKFVRLVRLFKMLNASESVYLFFQELLLTRENYGGEHKVSYQNFALLWYKVCENNNAPNALLDNLKSISNGQGVSIDEINKRSHLYESLMSLSESNFFAKGKKNLSAKLHYMQENKAVSVDISQEVIPELFTNKGQIKDDVERPLFFNKAYKHRHVRHLKTKLANLFFKQAPDYGILAYSAYLLIERVARLRGVPPILGVVEVTVKNRKTCYPVLVSEAVAGKTLETALEFDKNLNLNIEQVSRLFFVSLIVYFADGFARNFIKTESGKIIPVDLEQVFGNGFETSNSKDNLSEINIIYCLNAFHPGGAIDKNGFSKATLQHFAALDIDNILNAWLNDIEKVDKQWARLLNKYYLKAGAIGDERDGSHPFVGKLFLPQGFITRILHHLNAIKELCRQAINKNEKLTPKRLMLSCRHASFVDRYYNNNTIISPLQRFSNIFHRMETSSSKDFLRTAFGTSKLTKLASKSVSVTLARNELKVSQFTDKDSAGTYMLTGSSNLMCVQLDFSGLTPNAQVNLLRSFSYQCYAYEKVSLLNCSQLSDAHLTDFLKYSKNSLRELYIKGSKLLTDKIFYEFCTFDSLEKLSLIEFEAVNFAGSKQEVLNFKSLKMLNIFSSKQMRIIEFSANEIEEISLKDLSSLKIFRLKSRREFFPDHNKNLKIVAIEHAENLQVLNLHVKDNLYYHCYLQGVSVRNPLADYQNPPIALHWAIQNDLLSAAFQCIEREDDIFASDANGDTPLIMAVKQNQIELLIKLIEVSEQNNSLNNYFVQKNSAGKTALIIAQERGYQDIENYLLKVQENMLGAGFLNSPLVLIPGDNSRRDSLNRIKVSVEKFIH